MSRLVIAASIILIVGCAPTVPQSVTAQQGLNAAIARATNAAIDDQAIQQATAQAQQQAQQAMARATAQASNATAQADYATRQAIDATEQARQAIARATEQARAAAVGALTLEQAQAAATATRSALDRQMVIDAQTAQRVSAETQATIGAATLQSAGIRATSTVVAKLQASDDDTRALAKQDAEFTFWLGWIAKGGAILLAFIAVLTVIEVLRKRGAVSMVGKMVVAVDGGAVGKLEAFLLLPDQPVPLQLAAPAPAQPQAGQIVVNGNHVVDEMDGVEAEHRKYWRTRAIRFLQEAQRVKDAGYKKIPTCREMEMPNPEWVQITDTLKPWIDKQQGKPTLCVAPYDTLGKLYEAIMLRKIAPLPPDLYAKYVDNSYKQLTVEQSGNSKNSGNGRKTAYNGLVDAVTELPQHIEAESYDDEGEA